MQNIGFLFKILLAFKTGYLILFLKGQKSFLARLLRKHLVCNTTSDTIEIELVIETLLLNSVQVAFAFVVLVIFCFVFAYENITNVFPIASNKN